MILNFSIQNFGCVKEKQTLSFVAEESTHLEDTYVVNVGGHRILKLALVYGANASGKTTLLKAFSFLRDIVTKPKKNKTSELDFNSFLFDPASSNQNSILSIEFLHKSTQYFYELEFFNKAIVSEELYLYKPNKEVLFKRKTNLSKQLIEIAFGESIFIDKLAKKELEANTLWNNTVLGSFLKQNVKIKEFQDAVAWFKNYLNPWLSTEAEFENFISLKIREKEISKTELLSILKKAEFHISDIFIEEEEPHDSMWFSSKQVETSKAGVVELEEKTKSTRLKVGIERIVNKISYRTALEAESQGTRRYYCLAGALSLLLRRPSVFSIDDLETYLHPDLFLHFLLSFLLNSQNSQIIATTKNREILENKEVFRNDAIWFIDKQEACATELYSLADFDKSVINKTTNILQAYKSGKLSGTPNLGDPFIDVIHEEI